MIRSLILSCAIIVVYGCSTSGGIQPGSGSTFEVQGRSYDDVWRAAVTVSTRIITIESSDKATGTIRGHVRAGMTTWGEVVAVFITQKGDMNHTVEVVSNKRSKLQVTGENWEQTIIAGIKAELNM